MGYKERWHIISEIGEGGQGKVYRVYDKNQFDIEDEIPSAIRDSIRGFTGIAPASGIYENFDSLRKALVDLIRMEDPVNHGALKILHNSEDARDPERAEERIKREVEAMASFSHPNLLKILF